MLSEAMIVATQCPDLLAHMLTCDLRKFLDLPVLPLVLEIFNLFLKEPHGIDKCLKALGFNLEDCFSIAGEADTAKAVHLSPRCATDIELVRARIDDFRSFSALNV